MVRIANLSDGGGHRAASAQFCELKGLTCDDVLVLCENVARPRKQRGKAEAAAEPAIAAGGARDGEAHGQLENLAQETAPTAPPLPGVVAQRTPPGIVLPAHLHSTSSRALLLRPSLQSRARSRRLGGEACPRMSSVPELSAAHDLAPARASSMAELRAAQRSSRRLSGRLSSRRPAPPPGMPPGMGPAIGTSGGGDAGEVLVPRGTPPALPPLTLGTLSPGVPLHAGSPSHAAAARSPPARTSPPQPSPGQRAGAGGGAGGGAGAVSPRADSSPPSSPESPQSPQSPESLHSLQSPQSSPGEEGGAEGGAGGGAGGGRVGCGGCGGCGSPAGVAGERHGPLAAAVGATALFSGEPIASAP